MHKHLEAPTGRSDALTAEIQNFHSEEDAIQLEALVEEGDALVKESLDAFDEMEEEQIGRAHV